MFGHWDWGVDVCERVNSKNVKLVCDLYHLQIMDGDIAQNVRDTIQWIAHFHTAGVPTRNEIDYTQEMNYRYIAEVIAGLPFAGYVSHEWRPGSRPRSVAQPRRSARDHGRLTSRWHSRKTRNTNFRRIRMKASFRRRLPRAALAARRGDVARVARGCRAAGPARRVHHRRRPSARARGGRLGHRRDQGAADAFHQDRRHDDQGRFMLPELPDRHLQRVGARLRPGRSAARRRPPRRHGARSHAP